MALSQQVRTLIKIAFILGGIALVCLMVSTWTTPSPSPEDDVPQLPKSRNAGVKRVRFRPTVKVAAAGGTRQDRFNPDLRSGVARNAELAARVGGARRLAYLSLMDAGSSASSEEN